MNNLSINEKCVHDLFSEQAKLNPEKIAVTFNQRVITYYELNKKSDYLASILREKMQSSTPIIGIAIERSIYLIIAVLGILKSGGVCVPLDISYPENRLEFMANDANLDILLTTTNAMGLSPNLKRLENNYPFLYLDSIDFQLTNIEFNNQQSFATLNELIYILYTSGSTGQPKGVAMPHRALSNLINWHLINEKSGENSCTLQFSPISFDVAFQEIFSTLCAGQRLVLVTEETRKDPYALFELIRHEKISRLFLPTVALQQLAEVTKKSEPLKTLDSIITAGEQLKITPEIELLFENNPEASLYNHYGPTETHVVTSYKLSKQTKKWPSLPPIGFPISNVNLYILDENHNKVKSGDSGELYIGGYCLANGYHHRPDLTKERFIINPFGSGLLYKTGDLVCSQPDGAINYLGRIDRQVKIRGFRIELSEIEVGLLQHSNITECVVVDREIEPGHKTLIAYIILNTEFKNKLDIVERGDFAYKISPRTLFSELHQHLSRILPSYMIPSSFIIIQKIPLTPSGKVDRAALPLPPILDINSLVNFIKSSQKTLEEKITMIWEELLQLKPVANNENFFDLGGHSFLLLSLHKILSNVLDRQFPETVLFKNPTIESLVTYFSNNDQNLLFNKESEIQRNKFIHTKSIRKNLRKQENRRNYTDE